MIAQASSLACPTAKPKSGFWRRIGTWWANRPTRKQHRATLDLLNAPQSLRRDLGVDDLQSLQRRW